MDRHEKALEDEFGKVGRHSKKSPSPGLDTPDIAEDDVFYPRQDSLAKTPVNEEEEDALEDEDDDIELPEEVGGGQDLEETRSQKSPVNKDHDGPAETKDARSPDHRSPDVDKSGQEDSPRSQAGHQRDDDAVTTPQGHSHGDDSKDAPYSPRDSKPTSRQSHQSPRGSAVSSKSRGSSRDYNGRKSGSPDDDSNNKPAEDQVGDSPDNLPDSSRLDGSKDKTKSDSRRPSSSADQPADTDRTSPRSGSRAPSAADSVNRSDNILSPTDLGRATPGDVGFDLMAEDEGEGHVIAITACIVVMYIVLVVLHLVCVFLWQLSYWCIHILLNNIEVLVFLHHAVFPCYMY